MTAGLQTEFSTRKADHSVAKFFTKDRIKCNTEIVLYYRADKYKYVSAYSDDMGWELEKKNARGESEHRQVRGGG